jgi:hypothetical protein
LKTWDGTAVHIMIDRYHTQDEVKEPCRDSKENCVAGRRNAVVAPVIPAAAVTGSAILAAVAKSSTTRVIGATALFALASQQNIGDLLNGTDAQLSKDEIFDLYITCQTRIRAAPPKP